MVTGKQQAKCKRIQQLSLIGILPSSRVKVVPSNHHHIGHYFDSSRKSAASNTIIVSVVV
ncbi:hypothetical protein DERP_014049 [Dermatophagoides pteronyssinus]|uniref:Uncharacterized protein n=1 Tax=Dermatophagoides pteronyssinus TaxID=6956 RepID=A0ABQ8JDI6_DERPT|nr:hypothetical protein DERP_014049 [Dermatophagoides pteronyssinus]